MKRLTNSTMTILLAAVALVGCRNDFDFEEAHNSIYSENLNQYNESFRNVYGEISSNQRWDFSDEGTKIEVQTRANGVTTTLVPGIDWGLSDGTTVTKNLTLYNQIKNSLPDGVIHTGNQAVLTAPANSFTIYPLTAQGGYTHDLYVKVGDEPEIMIYSKYWDDWTKPYCHGMRTSGSETVSMPGLTITAPVGTPVQLYLKNVSGYSGKNFNIGTGTGNAIIVDCPVRPEGLPETIMPAEATIKFIGIEDCVEYSGSTVTSPGGDTDYNDLVVMIVGTPKVPDELKIENGGYERYIAKRYMIEDLGAANSSDIDFNDIVIDLETYETHETEFTNGSMTKDEFVGYKKQKAIVRAMGGTLNFSIHIGNHENVFKKAGSFDTNNKPIDVQKMYNTGWDANTKKANKDEIKYNDAIFVKDLPDGTWIPNANSIWVEIIPSTEGEHGLNKKYAIKFPENGEVPQILAFDVDKKWNMEREGIRSSADEWWNQ